MRPRLARFALALALIAASSAAAHAQCATQWTPLGAPVGTDGIVFGVASRDPDGAGPQAIHIVAAGEFALVGGIAAARIAIANTSTGNWSALGSGLNGTARCVLWLGNGDIVVGGAFTTAGGIAANRVARWNGTTWSPLGVGCDGEVLALLPMPNGDIVAAGTFQNAGGQPAARIARWNGAVWSPIGTGFDATVRALALRSNGDLAAGGDFLTAGGSAAARVAVWNGAAWSALGTGTDDAVHCFASLLNGDLVAGGKFVNAGVPANHVARWNGTTWSAFGAGLTGGPPGQTCVHTLAVLPNGDLVACGRFEDAGFVFSNIARWSGSAWTWPLYSSFTGTDPTAYASNVMADGRLLVGGAFPYANGIGAWSVAMWNGTFWRGLQSAIESTVMTMLRLPNGDLAVGGQFNVAGMSSASRVARWNGSQWSSFGAGVNNWVVAMTTLANGNLVVGGWFTSAGGVPVAHVAQWNGTAWSAMGSGLPSWCTSLGKLPNGDVIAGDLHAVYRWTGSTWQTFGNFGSGGPSAFAVRPNGELIVAGNTYAGSLTYAPAIGRWSGGIWSVTTVGTAGSSLTSVLALPNGDLVFGGQFATLGGVAVRNVAHWNGSTFSPLGTGVGTATERVAAVTSLADGSIAVGGTFTTAGGIAAKNVARWNGSTWAPMGVGIEGDVFATLPTGDGILVGGAFPLPSGGYSSAVAEGHTPCVATATILGAGCTGPFGANVLTATTGPWAGTTFRATGTGMPPLAFVGSVYGFSTKATPLAALLPGALPGCDLLVHPDITEVLLPASGVVQSAIAIPNVPTALGFVFHHQLVVFELVGVFQVSNITSTNGLTATVGSF